MLRDIAKNKLFFGIVTLGLLLSFSFNTFGAMQTASFNGNFKDSEALVSNQIICHNLLFDDQLLLAKDPANIAKPVATCSASELIPYSSQFGLQGKIFATGYLVTHKILPFVNPEHFIVFAQLLTSLASALLFAMISLWVKKQFGLMVAILVGVLIALSPMLVGFARNLYWMLPLLIAPFVFALCCFRLERKGWRQVAFWFILGVLVYLKYLCGYEYITTITLMIFAPIVYLLYVKQAHLKVFVTQAIYVLAVSFLAFSFAMLTHITALTAYTGNFVTSIQTVTERARERTLDASQYTIYPYGNLKYIAPNFYDTTNAYVNYGTTIASHSIFAASIVNVVTYLFIPVLHLPIEFNPSFGEYLQSTGVFIVVLAALFTYRSKWVSVTAVRSVNGLFLGVVVGFLGYASWLILAFSHSLVHAHINGILLYMPLALFGYIIIGIFIQSLFRKIYKKYKK